jgi:hypothetical protein
MITKEVNVARFDMNSENKTLSIRTDTILKEDGVEIMRRCHRGSFVPGQIDRLIDLLGHSSPEIAYLKKIWTNAVIKEYEDMIAAQDV